MNPRFAPGRGGPGGQDRAKYLADALGITVEKLQAAMEAAAKAEQAQAIAEGRLPQAQADQMAAERALQKYIADKGLFKAAVESAVKDGVITSAQATQILSRPQPGMFGGGPGRGPGGPGGPGGRGPGGPGPGREGGRPWDSQP